MTDILQLKKRAGDAAADEVQSGMVVGLGTGSTAKWMVQRLGERLKSGELENIVGVPTSERTADLAREWNIPLTTLGEHPDIDIAIDGADEIDPHLNLIKGGGGALLREKIVAQASKRFIVVADDSKVVDQLGIIFRLPVEVLPFGHLSQRHYLESLGASVVLRGSEHDEVFTTENGNYIYDCAFGGIEDPHVLARQLINRAGILEHGLFLGFATEAIIVSKDGIKRMTRQT